VDFGLPPPLLSLLFPHVCTDFLNLVSSYAGLILQLVFGGDNELNNGDKVVPAAEEHDGEGEED
jgi:hypothetical protein